MQMPSWAWHGLSNISKIAVRRYHHFLSSGQDGNSDRFESDPVIKIHIYLVNLSVRQTKA
jgi:hypothetical protein